MCSPEMTGKYVVQGRSLRRETRLKKASALWQVIRLSGRPACWLVTSGLLVIWLLGLGGPPRAVGSEASQQKRYLAVFSSGRRVEGAAIFNWHQREGRPTLDATELQPEDDSLLWLRDRSLVEEAPSRASPTGCIEFVGGDRLPGRVVRFVTVEDRKTDHQQAQEAADGHVPRENYLLVEMPPETVRTTLGSGDSRLRIRPWALQRIRWDDNPGRPWSPGTLFLRSGAQIALRQLRWQPEAVGVLTEKGVREFPFSQIAEVHFSQTDPWQAYCAELAMLGCRSSRELAETRLQTLATTTGLIITGTQRDFDARTMPQPRTHRDQVILARLQEHRDRLIVRHKQAALRLKRQLEESTRMQKRAQQSLQKPLFRRQQRLDNPAGQQQQRIDAMRDQMQVVMRRSAERRLAHMEAMVARQAKQAQQQLDALNRQIAKVQKLQTPGGNPRHSDRWLHHLHPSWSLDSLGIPFGTIHTRRWFTPQQVPLSRLTPHSVLQRSVFGQSWTWQANRTVQGGVLCCGGQEFGWGFGVHATNHLHFPLPPYARGFRAFVGLADTAGSGGSIYAAVSLQGTQSRTLFLSRLLTGADEMVDTGWLDLSPHQPGSASLALVVDAAQTDSPFRKGIPPSRAQSPAEHNRLQDPFDIRDDVCWLEPTLQLDPRGLQQAIEQARLPPGGLLPGR